MLGQDAKTKAASTKMAVYVFVSVDVTTTYVKYLNELHFFYSADLLSVIIGLYLCVQYTRWQYAQS